MSETKEVTIEIKNAKGEVVTSMAGDPSFVTINGEPLGDLLFNASRTKKRKGVLD